MRGEPGDLRSAKPATGTYEGRNLRSEPATGTCEARSLRPEPAKRETCDRQSELERFRLPRHSLSNVTLAA